VEVIIFIIVICAIFVGVNLLAKGKRIRLSKRLQAAGRIVKRDQQFETHTELLVFSCSGPAELFALLQQPGYLMTSDYAYTIDRVESNGFSIHCQAKPKWDAELVLEVAEGGTDCELAFMFTKWTDWATLQWGSANECLTVIERTLLSIDPGTRVATFPNRLENSVLKGAAGMLGTALHNLGARRERELVYSSLAERYQSAPPFHIS
jgi:hypothetical protein